MLINISGTARGNYSGTENERGEREITVHVKATMEPDEWWDEDNRNMFDDEVKRILDQELRSAGYPDGDFHCESHCNYRVRVEREENGVTPA